MTARQSLAQPIPGRTDGWPESYAGSRVHDQRGGILMNRNIIIALAAVAGLVVIGLFAASSDDEPVRPSDLGYESCAELQAAYLGAKGAKERSSWPSEQWQFHAERQNELYDALRDTGCWD